VEEDTCVVPWVKTAPALLEEVQGAISTFDAAREALDKGDGPPVTRISPQFVRAVGPAPVASYWELHGLYCLLAALLQRLELSLQAVREYAQFVCFLPVYRATVVDMEAILPEICRRTSSETSTLAKAYEMLPRASAPPCRGAVLEKCRGLDQQISQCGIASMTALVALKACTPQATLNDFEGWKSDDRRWLQVARLQVAAQALLPRQELVALNIQELATNLRLGGQGLGRLRVLDSTLRAGTKATERATGRCRSPADSVQDPPVPVGAAASLSQIMNSSLGALVDEDTRLHTLGCNVGCVGRRMYAAALPLRAKATQQVLAKLEGFLAMQGANVPQGIPEAALDSIAEQVSKLVCSFLGYGTKPLDICDGDWVMLEPEERQGSPRRSGSSRGLTD